jgi:hypothetical protein
MNMLNRRNFLWTAGAAGAAVPLTAALDLAGKSSSQSGGRAPGDLITFRAVAPLPQQPLPAYASHVLTGHIDVSSGTGMVTQTVFAGGPAAMSEIALPGLTRSIRVTSATESGDTLHVQGVVDDRSQLRAGESPLVELHIDRAAGLVEANFLGSTSQLRLEA